MTTRPPDLVSLIGQQLSSLSHPEIRNIWVAYSGGLDSHVLLHAACGYAPGKIRAIHINHQLQPEAGQWEVHCEDICKSLGARYISVRVDAHPEKGQSPEAVARSARYRAFAEHLQAGDIMLLAHHQDDQAETLMLQLLRGAGVKGLASMPRLCQFGHDGTARLLRPFLGLSRAQLHSYAVSQQLSWIEDPSNQESCYDRNLLRNQILPLFEQRWPSFAQSLARSALYQAEASELLEELACQDLDAVQLDTDKLRLPALLTLSKARQKNLLRYWITRQGVSSPGYRQLQRILDEVIPAAADAMPCISWADATVQRHNGYLYLTPVMFELPEANIQWNPLEDSSLEFHGIKLIASLQQGAGIPVGLLKENPLVLRFRKGGERCQLHGRQHSHSLKKLLQEWQVPHWERERVALLYWGERLAQIGNYALCDGFMAKDNETGIVIEQSHSDNFG